MSSRDRSSETSWAAWYAHQTDEVGTEQLPFTDDPRPNCPNCGSAMSPEQDPERRDGWRCPECWARTTKSSPAARGDGGSHGASASALDDGAGAVRSPTVSAPPSTQPSTRSTEVT